MAFHRADFQQALVKHLDPSTTSSYFCKRLVSYTQAPTDTEFSPIRLHFKDGTIATCDVLIGADGIHSVTRAHMLREVARSASSKEQADTLLGMVNPVWSGSVAYRGIIPRERLEAVAPGHRTLTTATNVGSFSY